LPYHDLKLFPKRGSASTDFQIENKGRIINKMISIVCVYNNETTYKNVILKSLENQTVEFELILVDNRDNKFKSAAEALNHGGMKTKGEYIMFVHQDVFLGYNDWLKNVETFLDSLPDLGAAGVAGVSGEGRIWRDQFKYSVQFINKLNQENGNITNPEEVQTLDECVLIVRHSIFEKIKFDEKMFDGWDCYGADYCLSIKKIGLKSYVIPASCSHSTMRSHNKYWEFRDLLFYQKKLYKKHRNDYKNINTWMGKISWLNLKIYSLLMLLGPLYSKLLFHSSENIWKKELLECDSILDLGCGCNSPVKYKRDVFSAGVDLSGRLLQESKRLKIHTDYIQADIRKIKFKQNSFDAVIAVNTLEHLTKEDGLELIKKMQSWARKKVILVTQNGSGRPNSRDNINQYYKSCWSVKDLELCGFKIRGLSGWKDLKDYIGSQRFKPAFFWERISELTQNLIYNFPDKASRLFAVKKINN
jgi:2-polyprenyl-3-methyl-5-hydroxy-6-metoxy-1,4-benzoquinol methylase